MSDIRFSWTENSRYSGECEAAVFAVARAAELCRAVQAGIRPDAIEKKDRSPVTLADFGSQAIVCNAIAERFPYDPIMAEEDSVVLRQAESGALLEKLVAHVKRIRPDADAQKICDWIDLGGTKEYKARFWTLDPIDGTKGFLRGEQYAIALALIVQGRIEVAALACPNLSASRGGSGDKGAVLAAIQDLGAFELPMTPDAPPYRLEVSAQAEPAQIRFCESVEAAHSSHEDAAAIAEHLRIAADPVRLDSQAKYAVVARGGAEAYLRLPRSAEYREKIWDHAAGALIVAEAGGRVSDISGKPLDFGLGATLAENRGVIVSNGRVHGPILHAIDALGIDRKSQ